MAQASANSNDPSGGLLPEYGTPTPVNLTSGIPNIQAQVNTQEQQKQTDTAPIPSVSVPNQNPAAASGLAQQMQASQQYLQNLSSNSDALYNNAAAQTRTQLNQGIKNVREDFNSRGLLSSGGETGAELGQESAAQSSLASTRNSINAGLLQNAQGMQGNAFNTAATLAQPGPNIASPYLSGVGSNIGTQTANTQLANTIYGNLGSGIGSIAGAGLGSAIAGQQSAGPLGNIQGTPYSPSNFLDSGQAPTSYNPYGTQTLGQKYS